MLNHFNFRRFGREILLTNDFGMYVFLKEEEFRKFVTNKISCDDECYQMLRDKMFVIDDPMELFSNEAVSALREMKNYLFSSTALHIFAVTNACNLNCIYCQAKDKASNLGGYMTPEMGRKAVALALQSPSDSLTFEFQGGEPLLNFETIKAMIEYCEKNKGKKCVNYTLVSNLIALSDDKLDYMAEHHVAVSTSLDGPCHVHDYNRRFRKGGSSFEYMEQGLQKLKERGISAGAIETTTRYSLSYPEEIVDTFHSHGLPGIFLRPLTPLGFAQADWESIGYSAEEFLVFYRKAFERVLEINREGYWFPEQLSVYFLKKILHGFAYNYMELRSPCGASMGQMSYYYDGNVYTCDEGRMISESGNHAFRLGTVDNTYEELMQSPVCKATAVASVVESLPACSDCVYHPYCGVCPVVTYAMEKDIFPKVPKGFRCEIYAGILDMLFEKIRDGNEQTLGIFESWIREAM